MVGLLIWMPSTGQPRLFTAALIMVAAALNLLTIARTF